MTAAATLWMFTAAPGPVRRLPLATHRFVCIYTELERSGKAMGLWDRLTISLVLAGAEEGARSSGDRPVS